MEENCHIILIEFKRAKKKKKNQRKMEYMHLCLDCSLKKETSLGRDTKDKCGMLTTICVDQTNTSGQLSSMATKLLSHPLTSTSVVTQLKKKM